MEETVKVANLSVVALIFRLILDFFACCILIGLVWIPRDLLKYFKTKLEITNKRLIGKTGIISTNELDSPLNKINSVQIKQSAIGKMCNYGTLVISTSSSVYTFNYINNPNEFKTILNNQIEAYDDERIEKQAKKLASAIKN